MTDVPPPLPSRNYGHRMMARLFPRHTPLFVELGFYSSGVFTVLIVLVPFMTKWLYPVYAWIGAAFILLQIVEIIARDHLNQKQTYSDYALTLLTFAVALGVSLYMAAVGLHSGWTKGMGADGWEILKLWDFFAVIDVIATFGLENSILTAVYQRDEQHRSG